MKTPRKLFWFITVITTVCILFLVPPRFHIKFLSYDHEFSGVDSSSLLRKIGIRGKPEFRQGLDLAGGSSLTLRAEMEGIPDSQQERAIESAKLVIEKRVDLLGVSEPVIQTAKVNNEYRIIVELPGITDINEAVARVGTTAKLEFRKVLETASESALLQYEDTAPINLSGADLEDAQVGFDSQTGGAVVQFRVQPKSQTKFFETTQKLVGKQMAICLDKQCFSAPTVQQAIRDNGQITGNFTSEQAKFLASQLNAGALPVPLTIIQQNTIGATLGEESLHKSLFAGILSFLVIVIFMLVFYGKLGFIASIALFLYILFVLTIFKLSSITPYPVTLSLAGIAGLVLSVGMAVDANILIFERMREELRRGKTQDIALELGFARAWSSIRDSNVSSIVTSIILFQFGSGIVRGFAVTLLIGVVISMFSAITVTRTFLRIMFRTR